MVVQNAEEERHKIDAKVHQLQLQISALRTQRNSFSIISPLPAELLTIIFQYARDFSPARSRAKTAIFISWVCRMWRQVSLASRRLWLDIDFDHLGGIEEFLTRSNDIRLSLSFWVRFDDAVDSIFNHTKRFQSFSHGPRTPAVPGHPTDYLDLDKHWLTSSPNLESLTLTQAKVPAALSTDRPPLQELSLTDCLIDWDVDIFSEHLTKLYIERPAQVLDVVVLLGVLAATPSLEYLSLVNGFQAYRAPVQGQFFIELPALETITIQDNITGPIYELLEHLILPGYTTGRFTFNFDNDYNGSNILIPYRAARINPPPLVWMRVRRNDKLFSIDTLEETMSSCEQETFLVTHTPLPPKPLNLPHDLDLTSLTTFHLIHFDTYYEAQERKTIQSLDWRRALGRLPNLDRITLEGDATFYFLHFLADEGKDSKLSNRDALPPSLRPRTPTPAEVLLDRFQRHPGLQLDEPTQPVELTFKALREVRLEFPPANDEGFPHRRIDDRHLIIDLSLRKALGFGLTRLEYSGWPISENTLKQVKDVVEEVECCDG